MNAKTLTEVDPSDLAAHTVVVRADLNVPIEKGVITDDRRIEASARTLRTLVDAGAKVVLLSHLGRPKGGPDPKYSLAPVAKRLQEILGTPVKFVPHSAGEGVRAAVASLAAGEVALLENTRFLPGDEGNDPALAREWASLGDLFVNDAFGAAHRAHASTSGLAEAMKARGHEAVAGSLMALELRYLGQALDRPERPFVAILGGAKISGKIDVIQNLMGKVDALLIGGGMMFTFYKAQGMEIGKSLLEEDKIDLAGKLLADAKAKKVKLLLPVDALVADKFDNAASTKVVPVDKLPADWAGVDIGPETVKQFCAEIRKAKTIVWNGPMGVFEMPNFSKGTTAIAQAMADATKSGAVTIVGGGDSASAIAQAGLDTQVSHVSTGGGASLEFLEGKVLPGVAALNDKP